MQGITEQIAKQDKILLVLNQNSFLRSRLELVGMPRKAESEEEAPDNTNLNFGR